MRILVVSLALASLALPAAAQSLPQIEPAKVCDPIARLGGPYDPAVYDTCLVKEQRAYAALQALWPLISAQIQTHCQGETDSYENLAACAKRQAASLAKHLPFKF